MLATVAILIAIGGIGSGVADWISFRQFVSRAMAAPATITSLSPDRTSFVYTFKAGGRQYDGTAPSDRLATPPRIDDRITIAYDTTNPQNSEAGDLYGIHQSVWYYRLVIVGLVVPAFLLAPVFGLRLLGLGHR